MTLPVDTAPGPDPNADLLVTQENGVVTLTLNRPARRNAVLLAGWDALTLAVRTAAADPATRVLVLRGAGQQAFSAGGDLKEFPTVRADAAGVARYHEAFSGALRAVAEAPQPTIAQIYGHCIGGGCALALACDLRLADEAARFAIPAARLGVVLGPDELQVLTNVVGPTQAQAVLLTGRTYDAAAALRIGLITELHTTAALDAAVHTLTTELCAADTATLQATKDLLARVARHDPPATIAAAHAVYSGQPFPTQAMLPRTQSFLPGRATLPDRLPPT